MRLNLFRQKHLKAEEVAPKALNVTLLIDSGNNVLLKKF